MQGRTEDILFENFAWVEWTGKQQKIKSVNCLHSLLSK